MYAKTGRDGVETLVRLRVGWGGAESVSIPFLCCLLLHARIPSAFKHDKSRVKLITLSYCKFKATSVSRGTNMQVLAATAAVVSIAVM